MSEFREYPITDKIITYEGKSYSIAIARPGYSVLSASNYDTGKELRLAVWDLARGAVPPEFDSAYSHCEKYDTTVAIETNQQQWCDWSTLTAHLDVRVLRYRMDNPPELKEKAIWKKLGMIADMLYLYFRPADVTEFPLTIRPFDGFQCRSIAYGAKLLSDRPTFLRNPDLFAFTPKEVKNNEQG